MKSVLLVFFILLQSTLSYSQKQNQELIDSCLSKLSIVKNDKEKLELYSAIIYTHSSFKPEEGLKYEDPAMQLAQKNKWNSGIASIKNNIGRIHWRMGNFKDALKYHFEALKMYEQAGDKTNIISTLEFIGQDYADGGNYQEALNYFSKALKENSVLGDKYHEGILYFLFSWVYDAQGDYLQSSKSNLEALKIYEELGDSESTAIALSNIGNDMTNLDNYTEAINYFNKALAIIEKTDDKINLADNYNNIGKAQFLIGNYPEALKNHLAALRIAEEIKDPFTASIAYSRIGDIYIVQGNYSEALNNYTKAIDGFKSVSNKKELAGVYNQLGICYTRMKKYEEANKYFEEVLALSNELDSKKTISEYYKGTSILDSATGRWQNAYFNYQHYIVIKDSILNYESAKKIVGAQMQYESEKKDLIEKAIQEKKDIRQRTIRNSIGAVLAGSLIFLVVVYRQRNKISRARKRSDELLLNILPSEVAEELKEKGSADAKHFEQVTVMFTDFKGFTQVSEKLTPVELVAEIDSCFKAFDHIITKHGLEKIKTIGDSYMCASGLPVANKTNAVDTVQAAIEIRDFMMDEKEKRIAQGKPFFEIRIGCNTGSVVAGIVGIKKFAYDIWGDAVNIASRMESSGEAGKINISGTTYELVKNKFDCTHRGKVQAKNKGEIDMYFVNRSLDT